MSNSKYSNFISQDLNLKIEAIVKDIANKLSDPIQVEEISNNHENTINHNKVKISYWDNVSLSNGHTGICMLMAELSEIYGEDWDVIGHNHMLKINEYISKNGFNNLSLYSGLAGIGMGAYTLSKNGQRYTNFISKINNLLIKELNENVYSLKESYKNLGVASLEYDVIVGLAGIGRYLLFFKEDIECKLVLEKILKYMVALTEDIVVFDNYVPGWYTPIEKFFKKEDNAYYPKGNFNCGLSHGIPGPLALMSLALMDQIEVEGQQQAIEKILQWLDKYKIEDQFGISWSTHVTFEDQIYGKNNENISRMAWCYGTPGVARAIWLGGTALKSQYYMNLAETAIDSIFNRSQSSWNIFSPTFCHGFSGLLYILNLMYEDSQKIKYKKYIDSLLNELLKLYDNNTPFGFYNLESRVKNGKYIGVKQLNCAGVLEGAAGIALVLLSLIKTPTKRWDAMFLLN